MLASQERLRRAGLFQRVYSNRKSVSTKLHTLYVLAREPRSAPRLPLVGFVIGRKAEGKASQRNRAKRRTREAYRTLRLEAASGKEQVAVDFKQWYALVWVIKSEVVTANFNEITGSVAECLTKADKTFGKAGKRLNKGESGQSC